MWMKVLGITIVDFDLLDHLLIRYSAFIRYWKKREYNGTLRQSFVNFEKARDSVRREELHSILTHSSSS
jgi:hypothetical protein